MDKSATNMASNTEENAQFTAENPANDHKTNTSQEVGLLQACLVENTGKNSLQSDASEASLLEVIPELTDKTVSIPTDDVSTRPKRSAKPSEKCIQNRTQSDRTKLEKLWRNTSNAVNKLQKTPDSVEQIKTHTSEVRSCFHQYDAASLSLLEFLATFNDSEHQKEYETVQKLSNNRNEYIHTAITEANQCKKELMSEINSSQRSRSSRQSTVSSTTARAVARAEATAALKKVHLQQWRSMRESASALEIQQQELALTKKKMN